VKQGLILRDARNRVSGDFYLARREVRGDDSGHGVDDGLLAYPSGTGRTISRPPCGERIGARIIRETHDSRPICVHHVDFRVTVPMALERDARAVR
jgi:hypothetical protein